MRHHDLVIIGTGSGNSILDERFAGWDVAIVERSRFGGTCLNVGCIPTKMYVHTADMAAAPAGGARLGVDAELQGVRWPDVRDRIFGRIDAIVDGGRRYRIEDNPNVTVYETTARFVGPKVLELGSGETISGDRIVIAAGGRPIVPDVPGLGEIPYQTSDTIMRMDELPPRLAILGSGFVAAEFAHIFGAFGVDVTLVARSDRLLRAEDESISRRFTDLAAARWDVRLCQRVRGVERNGGVTRLRLAGPDGERTAEAE
ncbi:MAG: FAD-dependent oxidoreductase, partial [bacterium]|nr:FAD-dependent oxidoreductase [bacterium]